MQTPCVEKKVVNRKKERNMKTQLGLKSQILQIPHMLLQERDSKGWSGKSMKRNLGCFSGYTGVIANPEGCSAPLRQAELAQLR